MSQAPGGPLPLSLLLSISGGITCCFVECSLQLAVGGTELSLQAAAAAKHATRRLFQWPVGPSECA